MPHIFQGLSAFGIETWHLARHTSPKKSQNLHCTLDMINKYLLKFWFEILVLFLWIVFALTFLTMIMSSYKSDISQSITKFLLWVPEYEVSRLKKTCFLPAFRIWQIFSPFRCAPSVAAVHHSNSTHPLQVQHSCYSALWIQMPCFLKYQKIEEVPS